jgi:N-formylglutamate deformylase
MDESPPFAYQPDLAGKVQPLLRELLENAKNWANEWARAGGHA